MATQFEPDYERDVSKYIKYYKEAMKEVTTRVASVVDMTDIDAKQTKSLISQIAYILSELDKTTSVWVRATVGKAFRDGQAGAILSLGLGATSLKEAASLASFSALARATAEALIADTYKDLLLAANLTEQRVKDIVREVTAEQMRLKALQQLGRKTMKRDIIENLTRQGLSKRIQEDGWVGIVDAAGRRWNLTTYADMVVRTKLQQAYIEGTTVESWERGVDLGIITSHGATDACSNFEGAVISLGGKTPGYPTYAQLKSSRQIFHPNCKHSVNPIRSIDLLPEAVRKKAEKATAEAAKASGIKDYGGLIPPTTGKDKIKGNTLEYKFVTANSIKEANLWAKNNLAVPHVDYKGYALELANSTNQTLEKLGKRYPEVKDTKFVATSQERNRQLYLDQLERRKEMYLKAGYSEDKALEYAKRGTKRKTVSANVYAESTNSSWGRLEGICFNEKWAKDYEKLRSSVKRDVEMGWHPQGTEDPASIMTHEYGHQIDNYLTKNDLRYRVVTQHWNKYSTDEIAKGLSQYATKNEAEFFAEAFSEYIHNPNPREIASKVGKALEEAFKNLRK